MRKLQTVLRDLLLAPVLGLGIGLALGAVLWGVGTLAGGAANGLETARSGLMLAGGFTLLFGGILLLKGDSLPKQAFQLRPRPQQEDAPDRPRPSGLFRAADRRYTALLLGAGILLVSAAADYLVRMGR